MKPGRGLFKAELTHPDGRKETHEVVLGDLRLLELGVGETVKARLVPAKGCDLGWGPGKTVEKELHGGVVGLILDGRGRPLSLDASDTERVESIQRWAEALDVYPEPEAAPVG